MRSSVLSLLFLLPLFGMAQSPVQLTVFAGASNYQGDLQSKRFTLAQSNIAVGLGLRYELNPNIALRGELKYGRLEANDKYNSGDLLKRNLNFSTKLYDASALLEYSFNDLSEKSFSPYVFAGVAVYHFNPYTLDSNGVSHWLRPLNTEGQGLAQYPNRKVYKLNQFAVPLGFGVRVQANELVNVGFEVGARKLFTDYIDDVSTTYVDQQTLLNARGPVAVDLAYRGDELKNGAPYPVGGTVRGGPHKDWYYFAGVTISFRLFDLDWSPFQGKSAAKSQAGCPKRL